MTNFVFTAIEPGVAYEYAVSVAGSGRIGLVRKELAREPPYHPTRRWTAARGATLRGGFASRNAAARFLLSLITL